MPWSSQIRKFDELPVILCAKKLKRISQINNLPFPVTATKQSIEIMLATSG